MADHHRQLAPHFFQPTLDLVLPSYSVARELQLPTGQAAPVTRFATGHKTQNQFVGDQPAHQPLRILEILLTPTGRTVENACAKCNRMWGSSSSHTDRQYWAVHSITTSSTPCSRNHVKRWCSWLGMVTNRRRAGFSSGLLASTTTTIRTFLCTSIPATFIASSWRGSGRTHAKKVTHRHVLPRLLLAGVARHRLVQNARSGSNSKTASLHPECKQTFAVHAPSAYTPLNPIFMSMGGPPGPCVTQNPISGAGRSMHYERAAS